MTYRPPTWRETLLILAALGSVVTLGMTGHDDLAIWLTVILFIGTFLAIS